MFLFPRCFQKKGSDKTIRSKQNKSGNVLTNRSQTLKPRLYAYSAPKKRPRREINTIGYFACKGLPFPENNVLARKGVPFPKDNLTAGKEIVELPANPIDGKGEMMIAYL
jgi:hypothetical protein